MRTRSRQHLLARTVRVAAIFLIGIAACSVTVRIGEAQSCANCAVWNQPQVPFRIYGNTYYVGPHGLGSILIRSDAGLVLIDGALPESAPMIAQHVRALGFAMHDVKIILNTHAHFDHAGGISALQRMSGAKVYASPWSAAVLTTGAVGRADPQYGSLRSIQPVANVRKLQDGAAVRLGSLVLTAHFTPGHTPGGTTWTWQSCEASRCLQMVYADSLSAVSADGFRFSHNSSYPNVLADFQHSFAVLDHLPCDILMTPHPDASDFWQRIGEEAARPSGKADAKVMQSAGQHPLIDPSACRRLADESRQALKARLAAEDVHSAAN